MRLFQYWDTGTPPDEVASWIDGFRAMNPDMDHRLYDRDQAAWFIGKHIGQRERAAFETIAVPSMQSDYFRYCAIWAKGGVYVDADLQCHAPLKGLLKRAPRSMTFVWDGHLVASLLMCRSKGDPFVRASLDLSTSNIEARRGKNAYMGAGPAVMNAIRLLADPASKSEVERGFDNVFGRNWRFEELLERARQEIPITPEIRAAVADMVAINPLHVDRWLGSEQPAYKSTGVHWTRWKGPIYREPV